MKEFSLDIKRRLDQGTSAANRCRRQGFIPGVLCGHGTPSIALLLNQRDFENLARHARITTLFRFKSDDQELNNRRALVKEIQQNYLNGTPLHVDFKEVKENEPLRVRVPIVIKGEASGVKNEGGVLTVPCHELEVLCLPDAIPESIEVDVSELKINQSIKAGDIKFGPGITLKSDVHETVASVAVVKEIVEETPAVPVEGAEAAVPVEGAEAVAEGGEKAAQVEEAPKKEAAKKGE